MQITYTTGFIKANGTGNTSQIIVIVVRKSVFIAISCNVTEFVSIPSISLTATGSAEIAVIISLTKYILDLKESIYEIRNIPDNCIRMYPSNIEGHAICNCRRWSDSAHIHR